MSLSNGGGPVVSLRVRILSLLSFVIVGLLSFASFSQVPRERSVASLAYQPPVTIPTEAVVHEWTLGSEITGSRIIKPAVMDNGRVIHAYKNGDRWRRVVEGIDSRERTTMVGDSRAFDGSVSEETSNGRTSSHVVSTSEPIVEVISRYAYLRFALDLSRNPGWRVLPDVSCGGAMCHAVVLRSVVSRSEVGASSLPWGADGSAVRLATVHFEVDSGVIRRVFSTFNGEPYSSMVVTCYTPSSTDACPGSASQVVATDAGRAPSAAFSMGGSLGSALSDISPNDRDGVLGSGVGLVAGVFGQPSGALLFDGGVGSVEGFEPWDRSFTLVGWFDPQCSSGGVCDAPLSVGVGDVRPVVSLRGGGSSPGFVLGYSLSRRSLVFQDVACLEPAAGVCHELVLGTGGGWHQFMISFDAASRVVTGFVDGVRVGEVAGVVAGLGAGGGVVVLGGSDSRFILDDLSFFGGVLPETDARLFWQTAQGERLLNGLAPLPAHS